MLGTQVVGSALLCMLDEKFKYREISTSHSDNFLILTVRQITDEPVQ